MAKQVDSNLVMVDGMICANSADEKRRFILLLHAEKMRQWDEESAKNQVVLECETPEDNRRETIATLERAGFGTSRRAI